MKLRESESEREYRYGSDNCVSIDTRRVAEMGWDGKGMGMGQATQCCRLPMTGQVGETETGEVSYHKRKLELSYDTIHTIRYSLYDRGFALKRELKDCKSLGTFTSLQVRRKRCSQ